MCTCLTFSLSTVLTTSPVYPACTPPRASHAMFPSLLTPDDLFHTRGTEIPCGLGTGGGATAVRARRLPFATASVRTRRAENGSGRILTSGFSAAEYQRSLGFPGNGGAADYLARTSGVVTREDFQAVSFKAVFVIGYVTGMKVLVRMGQDVALTADPTVPPPGGAVGSFSPSSASGWRSRQAAPPTRWQAD